MDEKQLQALYNAVSRHFDIGDYNSFKSRMQTTEQRKSFYDSVGKNGFDLGEYNAYEQRIGGVKKKENSVGVVPSVGLSTTTKYGQPEFKGLNAAIEGMGSKNPEPIPQYVPSKLTLQRRDKDRKEALAQYQEEQSQYPLTSTPKLTFTDARVGGEEIRGEKIADAKTLGKSLALGASSVLSGTLKSIGVASKKLDFFNEYNDKNAEDLATYKAGVWIDETVKDLVGDLTPEEQDNFSVKLANGLGQAGGFFLGGAGSRLLKASPTLTTAFLGAGTQASSEYENAIAAGADPDTAAKVFWINGALGTSESLPFVSAFRKLDKYTGGLATGTLAKKLSATATSRITNDALQGMVTEALQEATQQALTNVTAQNTYDETRKIFDGVAESAAIGGIIGGVMHGAVSAIREKRAAGNLTPQEDADLAKAEKFAEQKIKEEQVAISNLNHAEKVREEVSNLNENQQDDYVKQSVREKVATQKAETLKDPTLVKQEKAKAKEASEIKEQLLQGKQPEEIITTEQQKKIDEEEKRVTELTRLKEDKEIQDKEFAAKRKELDGRTPDDRVKIEKLELDKKRADEDYQKKVAKLQPKEEDLLKQASEAAWVDIEDANIAKLFAENPKEGLKEAAQQLNASKGEAETARKVYGDTISDIALKLYPKEKVSEPIPSSKGDVEKPTVRVTAEQLEERQPSKIRERYIDDFNIVEDSSFMWRVTSQLSTADRKKAVADIKAGKDTAAARKLEAEIQETLDRGTVVINRGRGNNAETVEIPVDEWFQFSPIEQDRLVKSLDKMDENTISIINENDITLDNIDSLKHLFDGFPYEQSDLENIKTYLTKSSGSDKTRQLSEASEQSTPTQEQEVITEVGKPPTEPPTTEVPVEEGGGKPKSLLNRLMDATNLSETTKQGFREKGLKYEPQSHEEARKIAKEVVDNLGIEQAVTEAETNKLQGGVNSAVFAEALDRLYEQEVAAKTPQEKFELASKQAEIAIRFDEFLRAGGRDISQVQDFYKKSPLGVTIRENIKRKEDFENWSKPKEQSWKEFFEELRKEPEFEKLFKEKVKEELKTERAEARKARKEKVDKFFDEAKGKFEEGGAMYATIIPPKVITAAIEGMRKAYHAGEKVTELIQEAIDYISEKVGTWDSEKFRKEWEEKLKEKEPKRKELTDEELKARVLDKFRKKLKGLTEKQKDDVIRQAHKELINNGALEYEDFKKIIARVTGRGELSETEVAKLKELVAKTNELDAMAKRARELRTPEALNDFKRTEIEVAKATRELNEIFYNKPDIIRRLVGVMQLNTLGIVSLINNPVYNIWNQMSLRFPVGVINDAIDRAWAGIAKLMGKNYQREYNIWETQKDFWQMLGVGTKESMTQLMTGLNRADYTQKELHAQQIRPFKAIRDLIAWKKGEKHLSKRQVMDKAIQATVGIPAEAVARILNIGDKPQRFAAEGAQAGAFAKALGLKDMDKKLFMEFPREEAYREYKRQGLSDEAAGQKADYIRDAIVKEGERSTFQQDNLLNDAITSAFGSAFGGKETGLAALAKTLTISPYIKIPSNAFWSFYNLLNPEVAILQAMVHGGRSKHFSSKGQETKSKLQLREARYWMAHAIVGMAARAAVMALVQQGVFTPSQDKDDPKKERDATNFFERSGTTKVGGVNISNRWFGQWGMLGNQISKKYYNSTPEQRENQDEFWNIVFGGMEKEGLKELQNGVFSNSSAILDAFDKGSFDSYGTNTINMMTNIIQPATIAQINRASLDEVPTSRGDGFLERLNQQYAQRSVLYRKIFDVQIDKKRDIWGQKIPKGGNLLSRMFGISKANPQLASRPIYDDFLKTGDAGFLPPSVPTILNGEKLPPKQWDVLSEYVGAERKRLVEPFVSDMAMIPGYDKLYSQIKETEERKRVLEYLYGLGRFNGLEKFYQDFPDRRKKEKEEAQIELDEMYNEFKKEVKNDQ